MMNTQKHKRTETHSYDVCILYIHYTHINIVLYIQGGQLYCSYYPQNKQNRRPWLECDVDLWIMFCKFKDRAIIHVCPIKHVHGCVMRCFVVDGLAQVCSNSSALAMELLQTCAKPSILWIESKDTFTNNFQGCFHSGDNIHGTDVGLAIAIQMYWNANSSSHKEIHACYMDLSNTGHGLIPGCGLKHSAISLAICVVGISINQRDIAHLFRRRFECAPIDHVTWSELRGIPKLIEFTANTAANGHYGIYVNSIFIANDCVINPCPC